MAVEITTLPNGLRVATDEMSSVETATLGAWVDVGTRHENPAENGIAHLLEHMLFKGTKRRTAKDIVEEIEAVGGNLNAYTSREVTAYHAKVLKEDVRLAVDVLADMIQNSVFDESELERERAVVLQEIGQTLDTPDDIIFDYFQEACYPGQSLGRPVLGKAEIVSQISPDQLRAYIGQNYGCSDMVVSAAGNVRHEDFVRLIGDNFGHLPLQVSTKTDLHDYRGGEYRQVKELEQAHLVLGFPGVAYGDPDFYVLGVYATLLGGGMSSRLFQEVREKRGLVYSIYSFTNSFKDGGMFVIYAGTGEKEVRELVPVVCEELLKVTEDISEEEIRRAAAQLKAGLLMAQESTSSRCETLAGNILVYGRHVPVSEIVAKIDAVDVMALKKIARLVVESPLSLAALGPIGGVESFEKIAGRLKG